MQCDEKNGRSTLRMIEDGMHGADFSYLFSLSVSKLDSWQHWFVGVYGKLFCWKENGNKSGVGGSWSHQIKGCHCLWSWGVNIAVYDLGDDLTVYRTAPNVHTSIHPLVCSPFSSHFDETWCRCLLVMHWTKMRAKSDFWVTWHSM